MKKLLIKLLRKVTGEKEPIKMKLLSIIDADGMDWGHIVWLFHLQKFDRNKWKICTYGDLTVSESNHIISCVEWDKVLQANNQQ